VGTNLEQSPFEQSPFARSNPLVEALFSSESAAALEARLRYTRFNTGEVLETAGRPLVWLFFPDTALVSLTACGFGGKSIGVGLVGYGGTIGLSVILGSKLSHGSATVEIGGTGWVLATADYLQLAEQFPDIRAACVRRAWRHVQDASLTAVALGHLSVTSRLAWWLLEASRVAERKTLPMSHARLAMLLGVRRSSITEALHELESTESIRAGRKSIAIRNDQRLRRLVPGLDVPPEEELSPTDAPVAALSV
jgi:CRP-like cAMP-binding protein